MNRAQELSDIIWRRSSYSDGTGGNCVEVADGVPGAVPVRDSKNPQGPGLVFKDAGWAAFVTAVKDSTFAG
ncbi:DUF397 domain-containing protein [Streptomyces sp. NPDC054841]